MQPVKELQNLRSHEKSWPVFNLTNGESRSLDGVAGTSCELSVQFEVGSAGRCGVKVRASKDEREETLLYYDAGIKELVFDSTHSGGAGRKIIERAPFELAAGEPLRLRVFVDNSVVEVFANDRQAIGRRVYPVHPDSEGIKIFSQNGTTRVRALKAWEMAPSNPY